MLESLFFKKYEKGKVTLSIPKPFELTSEKIVQNPRSFNTSQIKNALENVLFEQNEEVEPLPTYIKKIPTYLLKDLFLKMHQTGLYNRQLSLWKTMGTIAEISFCRLEKGLLKKNDANTWIIDLFTSSRNIYVSAILSENKITNYKDHLLQIAIAQNLSRGKNLRGIFYFLKNPTDSTLLTKLRSLTYNDDQITKYESILCGTKDIRLNVIDIVEEDGNYSFNHILPQV